jgi:NTP pyrophosphatase (non-canonical NTP hydrolase)
MTPTEYSEFVLSKQADQKKILDRLMLLGPTAMQLDNAARGMADDLGEVCGCTKKYIEYGQPLDMENLLEELGDVLWRVVQCGAAIGYSLQDIIEANVRKLNVRYKGALTEQEAANRNLEAERRAIIGVDPASGKGETVTALIDSRIGCTAKPKFQTNPYYEDGIEWKVEAVDRDNRLRLIRADGVKAIVNADEWMVI